MCLKHQRSTATIYLIYVVTTYHARKQLITGSGLSVHLKGQQLWADQWQAS